MTCSICAIAVMSEVARNIYACKEDMNTVHREQRCCKTSEIRFKSVLYF